MKKIYVGSDHAAFEAKAFLVKHLKDAGHDVNDLGTYSAAPVDYPDFAKAVGEAVAKEEGAFGIVMCASGVGVSIAANKVRKIRAALCVDETIATMARRHNDANVLAMGGYYIGVRRICDIADVFLKTAFDGGRHEARVAKIGAI